ncbi:serine/threonine protein phosphatase 2A 55 kDa regulatory subunit B beta isoform-like [Asparagus officinalis]|uniref:serine/threonine protein phosphatase 2A 55 kDa regulatory subunit B beta isoform-like n=1 Tax=Asparagus officinalis TaxID=4686 RepID=UPI00098E71C1|nr:serine/threonine protein phosphatase 2A 55 kDa regulatory subunit B beta isoform-like [Asparagus officinalis]
MLFEEHEAPGSRSFSTEIIESISDIKFGKNGRHILSRDYMPLKLWDISMHSGPVATFQVNEYLRPKGNTIDNYVFHSKFVSNIGCYTFEFLLLFLFHFDNKL